MLTLARDTNGCATCEWLNGWPNRGLQYREIIAGSLQPALRRLVDYPFTSPEYMQMWPGSYMPKLATMLRLLVLATASVHLTWPPIELYTVVD